MQAGKFFWMAGLGIGGFALYSLFRTGAAAASLMVEIVNVDIKKKLIKLQFRNPSNKAIPLQFVFFDLKVMGSTLGQVNRVYNPATVIAANQVTYLEFPITSTLAMALMNLPSLLIAVTTGAKKEVSIEGYVKADDIRVNVRKAMELDLSVFKR